MRAIRVAVAVVAFFGPPAIVSQFTPIWAGMILSFVWGIYFGGTALEIARGNGPLILPLRK